MPEISPPPPRWHHKQGVMPPVIETFGMDFVMTMSGNGHAEVYVVDLSDQMISLALRTVAHELDPPHEGRNARDALWAVLVELVELAKPARTISPVELIAPCMHLRAALDEL